MSKKNALTPRSGKKAQGSILSFFGKSASRKEGTPSTSKPVEAKTSPVSAFRVAEKSGASSAKLAKSAPSFIPSTRRLSLRTRILKRFAGNSSMKVQGREFCRTMTIRCKAYLSERRRCVASCVWRTVTMKKKTAPL